MVKLVTTVAWCAAAVALVGACADRSAQEGARADEASSSAPSSVPDGVGSTTAPPAPTGTSAAPSTGATASPCASATSDVLQPATQLRYGHAIVQPFTVDTIVCSGDWARAQIPAKPSYPQSGMVLFHYIDGAWRAVQFGSGFDCGPEGVPAATAADLGC